MKVYEFNGNSNVYSVPFDWTDDKNYDYVESIVTTYFDEVETVGKNWKPSFFGVVNNLQKIADLGTLVGFQEVIFSQKAPRYLTSSCKR